MHRQSIKLLPKETRLNKMIYLGILLKQDEQESGHAKSRNIENTTVKVQAVNLQIKPTPPSNKLELMANFEKQLYMRGIVTYANRIMSTNNRSNITEHMI